MTLTLPALRSRGAVPTASSPATGMKAGPLGPGAGVLMTEWNLNLALPGLLGKAGKERMVKAMQLGWQVDWIRSAERVIRDSLVRCEFHIKDPDGEHIDADYEGDPRAIQAFDLINEPQGELDLREVGRRQTRRQQLTLTSRHMGIAGNAAWFLDAVDQLGIPHGILYVRPDRLTPDTTDTGVLKRWLLDARPGFEGTPIELDELLLMQFDPPDEGVFGIGLVESAYLKALNSGLVDRHFQTLLQSGGRISGVLAPKEGAITDDGVYNQLVRDWRNITEQPDAARRLQIVRAPVEFTSTVQSVADMALVELMDKYRDAGLALWGVPLTQLNGQNAGSTGLNGGMTREYDEAVLWQSAVMSRADEICDAYQAILDRFEPLLGWIPRFCWEPPEYDDDSPAWENAVRAMQSVPMRSRERREMVGLEPFGDASLDNAVIMPIGMAILTMAPDEDTGEIPPEVSEDAPEPPEPEGPAMLPPGQMPPQGGTQQLPPGTPPKGTPVEQMPAAMQAQAAKLQKAGELRAKAQVPKTVNGQRVMGAGTKRLRAELDKRLVPKVQDAVARALERQGDAIADAVERNWEHISQNPGDQGAWWREARAVDQALLPAIGTMAEQVEGRIKDAFGQ